ncbi:MAG: type II toxin-antitoxin system PrlF family antitoxin [Proteobacteria bacterium]|nr:type II toxin-antitoxin system PrlF family antitoxin [Pseudomonadota bacterium]
MSHLTQKGQVTIPLPIRKKLNLKTGDDVLFIIKNGEVVLEKRTPGKEAFQKFVGFLDHLKGKESDEAIEELRGKANDFSG